MNYRYFDEQNDAYWNTQGFRPLFGNMVILAFGFEESFYYNPDWLPFNVRGSAKVIAQVPDDNLEALGQLNLTLSQAYYVHPKTRLIPNLTFFARVMSLRTNPLARSPASTIFKSKIDQDVFTPYKADHTAGFSPGLTLEHRPWLDTVWSTKVGMGTNENFDVTAPDYYTIEEHWLQLLGSVTLDASYRITYYQPDGDRNNASKRSYAGLELNWQQWTDHQNRFELGAQYSYDIERKAHLATLSFTYHFGEGRGVRDFAAGDIDFRDIRQRQFVGGHNNVMRDVEQCAPLCSAP